MKRIGICVAIGLMTSATVLQGCGGCEGVGPTAPPRTEVVGDDVPSQMTEDGWTHWDLPAEWPAPPRARVGAALPESTDELVAALMHAYELGVPDVRGGALHEVELPFRSLDGKDGSFRGPRMVVVGSVRGVRFAIDEGVLVPVRGMGPELDLIERFTAALEASERYRPTNEICPLIDAWPEVRARSRPDLVDRYATLWSTTSDQQQLLGRRRHELTRRALANFRRGDDAAAWRDLAARHLLDDATLVSVRSDGDTEYPDETIVQLEQELELRRDAAVASRSMTIADEIDALLDVSSPGEPTRLGLANDPHVLALVARGETAVPALLDALGDTGRATRMVYVDPFQHRARLIDRTDAVYAALASILDVDWHPEHAFGDFLTTQDAATVATVHAAATAYWEELHALSPAERRWRILGDDARSPAEWAEAALWLVDASPQPRAFAQYRIYSIAAASPMQGEPLRARSDPSLSELLRRRIESTDDEDIWRSALAVAAARWDPRALLEHFDELRLTSVMTLLPALGEIGRRRLLETLRGHGQMLMFAAAMEVEVWVPYLLDAASDPAVAAALTAVLDDPGDQGLFDARILVGVGLARGGFAPARVALVAHLHDPSVYGELWPGAEALILGPLTVLLHEPVTVGRDVTRGEMTAFLVRDMVELPYEFGVDQPTRERQLAALVAALEPRPSGSP